MGGKIPEEQLRYREKVGEGKIMRPSTFKRILEEARKRYGSMERARRVAGAAYWKTLAAKFRGRKRK